MDFFTFFFGVIFVAIGIYLLLRKVKLKTYVKGGFVRWTGTNWHWMGKKGAEQTAKTVEAISTTKEGLAFRKIARMFAAFVVILFGAIIIILSFF